MIRAFVAIHLPTDLRAALAGHSSQLKRLALDASFPKPDSMHLTLKFLGDIREDQVDPIGKELEAAVAGVAPFQLRCHGIGVFPSPGNPRVVWAGVDLVEELDQVQREVEDRLSKLGFEPEGRRFSPHLTLARIKGRANLGALRDYLGSEAARSEIGAFHVGDIHLFRSELRPDGARYTRLRSVALS